MRIHEWIGYNPVSYSLLWKCKKVMNFMSIFIPYVKVTINLSPTPLSPPPPPFFWFFTEIISRAQVLPQLATQFHSFPTTNILQNFASPNIVRFYTTPTPGTADYASPFPTVTKRELEKAIHDYTKANKKYPKRIPSSFHPPPSLSSPLLPSHFSPPSLLFIILYQFDVK